MADRPILFSAPMVRALLDGRKTQTRRPAKFIEPNGDQFHVQNAPGGRFGPEARVPDIAPDCAPFEVGDQLWVKETWRAGESWDDKKPTLIQKGVPVDYVATPRKGGPTGKTRVSIFMPRWASRLALTVTDVRVERLNDCSEADALAEGVRPLPGDGPNRFTVDAEGWAISAPTAVETYRLLWNWINGPGAWEANPWVCAITFTVEQRNIDA